VNAVKLGNKAKEVSTLPRYCKIYDSVGTRPKLNRQSNFMLSTHEARQRDQNNKDDKEDKKISTQQATLYKAKPHVASVHDTTMRRNQALKSKEAE